MVKAENKRMLLQRANLKLMMETNSLRQIAEHFGVSITTVSSYLTEQMKKREIGFSVTEPKEIDISAGAWMNSPERKAYQQIKIHY